jgi:UDP-N-acetylglucosamine 2-epimerase (non-hydrolysing)
MTKKLKIILVAGARPNFMKVAPIYFELKKHKRFQPLLVHTGQHYDKDMSDIFFHDLGMPKPDIYLGVGSGTHSEQTAKVMIEFEKILVREDPDLVIVVGDVNSTIACSLATVKYRCTRKACSGRACSTNRPLVAHVEAGLRSFDRSMPEEINRLLTDQIADYLFTTCRDADKNLMREGIPKNKIFFVGNVMIDTLTRMMTVMKTLTLPSPLSLDYARDVPKRERGSFRRESNMRGYALVTLHRPSNVDEPDTLHGIMSALREIAKRIPVIFPVHPRTAKALRAEAQEEKGEEKQKNRILRGVYPELTLGAQDDISYCHSEDRSDEESKNDIILTKPLGYHEFMSLMANAALVLTDSGGIQEETTILGVPCLTIRHNTERPITITQGTNKLVGTDPVRIVREAIKILNHPRLDPPPSRGRKKEGGRRPELWDGKAAERIVKKLADELRSRGA